MDQDTTTENLWAQIDRCRRIASMMTDDEIRHALEKLASEYEEELFECARRGFMLRNPADRAKNRSS